MDILFAVLQKNYTKYYKNLTKMDFEKIKKNNEKVGKIKKIHGK